MFFLKYSMILVALWLNSAKGTSMEAFFPNANQNLTKITWAHAVNNQSLLEETLKNDAINMIEADIQVGIINDTKTPIMAHDPNVTSNLTLHSFLQQIKDSNANAVSNSTRKGAKLDFKTIEAFEISIEIVKQFDKGGYPIWINADIIKGPINATAIPVDPTRFLAGANQFSDSILSIGWTTLYGANWTGSYTSEQIQLMINTIHTSNITQEITFPVRGGLAAQSKDLLMNLTGQISGSTLTIWSSEGDNVNVDDLRQLIKAIGLNRTYVDVPEDLLAKLHLEDLSSGCGTSQMTLPIFVVCLVLCLGNFF
ncbi:unnamed protein product [Ceutorhynchus assimilis]|uniref:Menorin-like domain-containing protein n=1 Tax=Ceutorhynchus assimilis TaxID=467358 RepID=A0A9P0GVF0_9CUCU|nr:unnamed protein product [Ceutorhynchus assimilis]